MRRRLLVVALTACLAAAAPASARTVPFGFNDATTPHRLDAARSIGATVGRFFVCWCDLEPAPGRYDFHTLDRIHADFRAHGMRAVVDVVGTPTWAARGCAGAPQPCLTPPDESRLGRWRELFRLLALRYPDLYGVEVWNEANLPYFWKPRPDVPRYVRLLRAAYRGAKAGNRRLPVIAGALCLCGGIRGTNSLADFDFLNRMYRAGARGSFDAIGVHDYPTDYPVIANARDKLAGMRRVREHWGDRTPFWVTEAGISTALGGTGGHPRLSEDMQAQALVDLYKTLRQMPDVGVILLFRFADITGGFTTWEDGMGIVERVDGSAKPAGAALAAAVRDPTPYRRPPPVRLSAAARRIRVGQRVAFRVSGWGHDHGGPWVLWDVGGGGFYLSTGGRPRLEHSWSRPGLRRVGVRAGDELDAGEAFVTIRVLPRRR